jgi:hypothetical protein
MPFYKSSFFIKNPPISLAVQPFLSAVYSEQCLALFAHEKFCTNGSSVLDEKTQQKTMARQAVKSSEDDSEAIH